MKALLLYLDIMNQCVQLAKNNLDGSSLDQLLDKSAKVIDEISLDKYIKIPFIGDFSAGKSTVINAYIDRKELLPTNITPETAVAYELYYAPSEYIEHIRDGKVIATQSIDLIKDLHTSPGDVVYVYLDNPKIKSLIERGIVIVDMPGIDSGIEAHNNAITNYINFGTVFIVFTDVEQGSLRNSTISFLKEIAKYKLNSYYIISKSDKKPKEEVDKIRDYISQQIKDYSSDNKPVGVVSAVNNQIGDLESIISSLDANSIIEQKYKDSVINIISDLASSLNLSIEALSGIDINTEQAIRELDAKHQARIADLNNKRQQAQSIESSSDDVINDIRNGLTAKQYEFAAMIVNNPNDTTVINAEIMSTVRPIIIESLRREGQEFTETFGSVLDSYVVDIQTILEKNANLSVNDQLASQIGEMLTQQKDAIISGLQNALQAVGTRYASIKAIGSLVRVGGFILGPIVGLLINFLPDIIKYLFGGGEEKKIESARVKFVSEVLPKILIELKQSVLTCITKQQESIFNEIEQLITDETAKINQTIQQIQDASQMKESEIALKREKFEIALSELLVIKNSLN